VKILVLGSGGREGALAWGLARSPSGDEVIAMPGNPGIARFAETIPGEPVDVAAVLAAARRSQPDLVVVGPEAPLVAGVSDELRADGFAVFGPDAAAARIEGSKAYSKQLMDEASIATAGWEAFETVDGAITKLDELGPPYVVKADGLAAGKGVVVTSDRDEAVEAVRECLSGERFGEAGRTVVIEEFLDGEEASLIAFTDGITVLACEPAQDYKRALDDDEGPNTGGMGSYSPVPACSPELAESIVEAVIGPMVRATARRGAPFVGALYAGLALTSRGPRVVEFNARFGDPETQALIPRLDSDLADVCAACASGSLEGHKLTWSSDVCVSVVLASGGYPGSYATGREIHGLEQAERDPNVQVFHAGTAIEGGRLVTAGGRVLAVSAVGDDYGQARRRAYAAADQIEFEGKHLRTDIAAKAQTRNEEVG
jgi:phosphoribosylamine--glycine ligase